MEVSGVIERVKRVAAVRADAGVPVAVAQSALVDIRGVRAFLDAAEADLARTIRRTAPFPEATVAEATRGSLGAASKTFERAATLDASPALAGALADDVVTAGHVDAVTRVVKGLEPGQRERLLDRVDGLVTVAAAGTVEEFARRVRLEASRIVSDDGVDRLERQIRATTLSTWVDPEGMWNLRGRFDPVTGLKLASKLDNAVEALFAESTPASCPSDPIAKQQHLRALALARLVDGTAGTGRAGRPEFVAVIDITTAPHTTSNNTDTDTGTGDCPVVSWPIPIEIPTRILAELVADADVVPVVVRNGIVLHAPGQLNLGRTTRLANRAQRRALRALYRTCAIPGCTTSYDRCKLHHIIWWRHGGRTDLDNLLPVCSHHHHKIHDTGWNITLGPNRELTITFPDSTIRNTGPPNRHAA